MNQQDIKIVIYSSKTDSHFKKILDAIPISFPKKQINQYRTLDKFSNAVRNLLFGYGVIVIVVRHKQELDNIIQINGRLKDHSVILILEDTVEDLTSTALHLYPRYTGYIKEDYRDIHLVLEKMINKIENKLKRESKWQKISI